MEGGKHMEMTMEKFSEKLEELLALGKKKKNVLEYTEISEAFAEVELEADKMEMILEYLEAHGVDVLTITEEDDDEEEGGWGLSAEEIAKRLQQVNQEQDKRKEEKEEQKQKKRGRKKGT